MKVAGGAADLTEQDLDATGTEPEVAYLSLDPELQESLTVGRPIAGA